MTVSTRMAIQMEIILPSDKPSYYQLGRLLYPYDCMKRKLEKLKEEKLKIAKRKPLFKEKIEKLGKRRNFDFKSELCT